jgi:hypothetical protein
MTRRDILIIGTIAIPIAGLAQSSAWSPSFFNAHQNDTLIAFSDVVIPATDTPGAKDALVNRFLDRLLAASDRNSQNGFVFDLGILDNFSRQTAGADFVQLTPSQQTDVLEKMIFSNQRPSFDRLKGWTARIYYATQPGFDELNKGGRVPASFACQPV